jgi:GTP-binding protein HflX
LALARTPWRCDIAYETTFTETAFLVGVELKRNRNLWRVEDSLTELAALADTADLQVVGRDWQRLDRIHPSTLVGSGKLQELVERREQLGYDVLIFDEELSPRQLREIEKAFGEDEELKVLDRTALILDIFSQHARSSEGALQVELAQLEYRLPRLTRAWTHLARQAGGRAGGETGGVGVRGPGETQLEVDRRSIRDRISFLKAQLDKVRAHRQRYRQKRQQEGIPVISLVGYTNAGKSTLLNTLSGAEVLAADMLFATLDPTTRRVELPGGGTALFSDTVGFIQKLPHQLVAAFRATLEEVLEADLLIHVIDVTHPHVSAQVVAVHDTLDEIGATNKPIIGALNKVDRFADPLALEQYVERLAQQLGEFPDTHAISARTGEGVPALLARVQEVLEEAMVPVSVEIPYQRGDLVDLFHKRGLVLEETHSGQGTHIQGKIPAPFVPRFQEFV